MWDNNRGDIVVYSLYLILLIWIKFILGFRKKNYIERVIVYNVC